MKWSDKIPAYEGGRAAAELYNAGPVLADDSLGPTAEDSPMLLVSGTNGAEFGRYAAKLEAEGWKTALRDTAAFCSVEAEKNGTRLYAYLTKAAGEVRIIGQEAGEQSSGAGSYGYGGPGAEEICQYALYYDPENGHSPTTTNCGMFYIIKLADGSLFMIDGGDELQCSEEALAGMRGFLREFTGVPEGEKMRVAGWFFTHAHGDHVAACIRLLRTYPDDFCLERVFFNFPSYSVIRGGYDAEAFVLKATIRDFAPRAIAVKLHTNMAFTLAGTRFEVLWTHEDAIRPDDPAVYPFRDFNCTSTVLKMTTRDGNSVMWLGDTNVETERQVKTTVPAGMWKSDVVQVAHHCFNYLSDLYPMIDADWAMLPNSYFAGHTPENDPKRKEVEERLSDPGNIWYEDKTTVFRFEGGKYRVIRQKERVGREHDGTDLLGRKIR